MLLAVQHRFAIAYEDYHKRGQEPERLCIVVFMEVAEEG